MEIKYINRKTGELETEKVLGQKLIEWLYESKSGQVLSSFLAKPLLSRLYGLYQSSPFSRFAIQDFVREFQISLSDFLPEDGRSPASPYSNFNSFFARRFQKALRPFRLESNLLSAFAEARYLAKKSHDDGDLLYVKGKYLTAKSLLDNPEFYTIFEGGPILLARLCPMDYHRFHFPDDGKVLSTFKRGHCLHSVNPMALKARPDLFCENEREISILETKNFGKLAYIEVGAMMVGKIYQTYTSPNFTRGQEKGMFLFGGSTVIVLGEAGKWTPSQDLLHNSERGYETLVELGSVVAVKGASV